MTIYDLHSHWGTEKAYPLRGKAQQAKQIDIWKTECSFFSTDEMAAYFRLNDVKVMLDYGFTRELPIADVKVLHDEMIAFARANADVVLLGNDLQALPEGLALARRTVRIVKQNLVWAFAYNFLAIPLAMGGWVTPWMAGIGMSASSLLVVLNALRLQRN